MFAEYPDDSDVWEAHVAADVAARAAREMKTAVATTLRVLGSVSVDSHA